MLTLTPFWLYLCLCSSGQVLCLVDISSVKGLDLVTVKLLPLLWSGLIVHTYNICGVILRMKSVYLVPKWVSCLELTADAVKYRAL